MLQFAVFKDSAPASQWALNHARLLDRDDLVVPGEIDFKDGLINCNRRGVRPTALLLQYDAGEAGMLSLQTCLLPHREKPYILSVELARHRIAIFLAQAEVWQMHLSQEHPAMVMVQSARQIFTRAMVTPDPAQADAYGFKALGLALKASSIWRWPMRRFSSIDATRSVPPVARHSEPPSGLDSQGRSCRSSSRTS